MSGLQVSETDAQLVAAISAHNPDLAHKVSKRLKMLRLQCIVGRLPIEAPEPGRRVSIWHSLHWPFRQRG